MSNEGRPGPTDLSGVTDLSCALATHTTRTHAAPCASTAGRQRAHARLTRTGTRDAHTRARTRTTRKFLLRGIGKFALAIGKFADGKFPGDPKIPANRKFPKARAL